MYEGPVASSTSVPSRDGVRRYQTVLPVAAPQGGAGSPASVVAARLLPAAAPGMASAAASAKASFAGRGSSATSSA